MNKKQMCNDAFNFFYNFVRKEEEENGMESLEPSVMLVGNRGYSAFVPSEIFTEDNVVALWSGMEDLKNQIGEIIGLSVGIQIRCLSRTPIEIQGNEIIDIENYYPMVNVMLDDQCGAVERTLVLCDDSQVRHVTEIGVQEPFDATIHKVKNLVNCINFYNAGFRAASAANKH